jgi:hypothetical protein
VKEDCDHLSWATIERRGHSRNHAPLVDASRAHRLRPRLCLAEAAAQEWPSFRGPGPGRGGRPGSPPVGRPERPEHPVQDGGTRSRASARWCGVTACSDHRRGWPRRIARQGRRRHRRRGGPGAAVVASAEPRRHRRPHPLADRGVLGAAARQSPREGQPGQRHSRHRRAHGGGHLRPRRPGRVRLERPAALEGRPRAAESRPLRRSDLRMGPRQLARHRRRSRVRPGRPSPGLVRGRLRAGERPAALDRPSRRATGVGHPALPRDGDEPVRSGAPTSRLRPWDGREVWRFKTGR